MFEMLQGTEERGGRDVCYVTREGGKGGVLGVTGYHGRIKSEGLLLESRELTNKVGLTHRRRCTADDEYVRRVKTTVQSN